MRKHCVAALLCLLLASQAEWARAIEPLNVSIAVFDAGVPDSPSLYREMEIFPRIREIEARLLPFVLRETLVASGEWGAVRVVPEVDASAELLISGTIVRSDGEVLEIAIRAVDASGRTWIERSFVGRIIAEYGGRDTAAGPISDSGLYEEIAASLRDARDSVDGDTLDDIAEISLLRYAAELAPSAFAGFVERRDDETWELRRLPAENDPMLSRIDRIRRTEYVITDTVDAKFRELYGEIASTYDVWRAYRRKFVEYQEHNAERAATTLSDAPRGSWEAIKDQYDAYKWDRITEQERDRLAKAFDNEVGPTVDSMEVRVEELEGWVDARYAEWHRILEELYEVETRVEPAPPPEEPGQ